MARPLRIDLEDGWYHVMNRGIERRAIFADDADRRRFIDLLAQVEERFGVEVHGYCLMENHYHLILRTPAANLSDCMKWVGQSYSSAFNARHKRVGPLFQGRFKSAPVSPDEWLYNLSFYVHLNPVRVAALGLEKKRSHAEARGAGEEPTKEMIALRLKRLRGHRWSSFRAYAGYATTPDWLRTKEILKRASSTNAERQKAYREQTRERVKRGMDEGSFERFKDVVALGGAEFVQRVRERMAEPHRETENRWRAKNVVEFEAVVAAVEKLKGEPMESWRRRYGDSGKWLVLAAASRRSRLTQREMGRRLGGMDYSAVSAGLRRFEARLAGDASLRREFAMLETLFNVET